MSPKENGNLLSVGHGTGGLSSKRVSENQSPTGEQNAQRKGGKKGIKGVLSMR